MMTMLALILIGSIALIITTIVDGIYSHHNQAWTQFKIEAWVVLRICLLSVSLVSFMAALFMAFK